MLEIIKGEMPKPGAKESSAFKSEAELIRFIEDKYKGIHGLSKASLERVFAMAKKSLDDDSKP